MAENTIQTTKTPFFKITEITGTDPVVITPSGSGNPLRISNILVSNDDTADQTLQLEIIKSEDGGETIDASIVIGKITIDDGAGTNGVDAIVELAEEIPELFNQVDNAGNKFLIIPDGYYLHVTIAAITTDKQWDVVVRGAYYD